VLRICRRLSSIESSFCKQEVSARSLPSRAAAEKKIPVAYLRHPIGTILNAVADRRARGFRLFCFEANHESLFETRAETKSAA
jgi:hypothetical protein